MLISVTPIKIERLIKISFLLQGTMICGWDKRVRLDFFFNVKTKSKDLLEAVGGVVT